MHIINLQLSAGCTAAQKTDLLKKASQVVVETVNAPLPTVRIALQEIEHDHAIVAGEIGTRMATFVVYLIVGRTEEQKAALIAGLNKVTAETAGISDQHVRILVHDMPKTDIGMAGGLSAKAAGR